MAVSIARMIPVLLLWAAFAFPLALALEAQPIPAERELRQFMHLRPELIAFRSGETRRASKQLQRIQVGLGEKIGWRLRWADGPHEVQDRKKWSSKSFSQKFNQNHRGHLEQINRFRASRRYRDQTGAPYGADVIEILYSNTRHINGIKRVLMGYLFASFEIPPEHGDHLADAILAYNRRIRGDVGYVQGRYTPAVIALLQKDKFGIEEHHYYWSGRTQIIIPLIDAGSVRAYVPPPQAPVVQVPRLPIPTQQVPVQPQPAPPVIQPRPTPAPVQKKPVATPKKKPAAPTTNAPRKSFRVHNHRRR